MKQRGESGEEKAGRAIMGAINGEKSGTSNRNRAVVAGHVCLDITPTFSGRKKVRPEELLRPGKLIQAREADVHAGGAVANTGLAMRFLGIDTCLMGKVGGDPFGEMLLSRIKSSPGEDSMSVDPGTSTSYSIVLALPGSDRIFIHHPGANDNFSESDIDFERLKGARLFHLGYPPLMRQLYRERGESLERIFGKADEMGVITSLDMAAVDPDSEAGRQDWNGILARVLPHVDFFLPSLEELCFMTDRGRFDRLTRRPGKDVTEGLSISRDIEPLARRARELGARNIVIKCGAAGLYYQTGGPGVFLKIGAALGGDMAGWADKQGFERSYRPRRVLSGTGAGDTAIAAFLASLLRGYPLELCLKLAAATGASCVEAYDALSGLLPLERQVERIEAGLEKQNFILD